MAETGERRIFHCAAPRPSPVRESARPVVLSLEAQQPAETKTVEIRAQLSQFVVIRANSWVPFFIFPRTTGSTRNPVLGPLALTNFG